MNLDRVLLSVYVDADKTDISVISCQWRNGKTSQRFAIASLARNKCESPSLSLHVYYLGKIFGKVWSKPAFKDDLFWA